MRPPAPYDEERDFDDAERPSEPRSRDDFRRDIGDYLKDDEKFPEVNSTEFWHHHGDHGDHQDFGGPGGFGGHHGRHGHHHNHSMGGMHHGGNSKTHHKVHRINPYKKWLDSLPLKTKEQATREAFQFCNGIITMVAFWSVIGFFFQQGVFLLLIKKVTKCQIALENKYMGPEIVPVRPNTRQVAATAETAAQPVIQYIVAPPPAAQAEPAAGTGNIVSVNQMV